MARRVGTCCAGLRCNFPEMALLPQHTCPDCQAIVHVMCAKWDEALEQHVCLPCMSRQCSQPPDVTVDDFISSVSPQAPIQRTNPASSFATTPMVPGILVCGVVAPKKSNSLCGVAEKKTSKKVAKTCKACGGTDHQRRSSMLCSKRAIRKNKPNNKTTLIITNNTTTTSSVSLDPPVNTNKNKGEKTEEEKIEEAKNLVLEEELSKPKFINVNGPAQDYTPVINISAPDFCPIETTFRIASADDTAIIPTPKSLMAIFWSREIIEHICRSSNSYRFNLKKSQPGLKYWEQKRNSRPFTISCVYHFIAILYYFGITRLPSKYDYWDTDKYMPQHVITNELGMSRDRFKFLWRHFHVSSDFDSKDGEEVEENDNEELVEQTVERVVYDQEEMLDEDQNVEEDEKNNLPVKEVVWFAKLKTLIDHVREVSASLIWVLGTALSLDEMMIRCQGRSAETHRIKGKPIGEGFKWFVLATKNGYVLNFTPDGRSAAKNGTQEYLQEKSMGKVESMILFVTNIIEHLKTKQSNRIKKYDRQSRSRPDASKEQWADLYNPMRLFCLAMDNYFTMPKVISALRKKGIGVVGTSRFQVNWPPNVLKNIQQPDANFNDFYYCVDEYGTLIARWMDNGLVFVVSTLHHVGNIIKRARKRPRKTIKNKKHVDIV